MVVEVQILVSLDSGIVDLWTDRKVKSASVFHTSMPSHNLHWSVGSRSTEPMTNYSRL